MNDPILDTLVFLRMQELRKDIGEMAKIESEIKAAKLRFGKDWLKQYLGRTAVKTANKISIRHDS